LLLKNLTQPKAKTQQTQKINAFAFSELSAHEKQKFYNPVTLSSAAAFKLRLCGRLLRSKTTKLRLKNRPRSAATGAAML